MNRTPSPPGEQVPQGAAQGSHTTKTWRRRDPRTTLLPTRWPRPAEKAPVVTTTTKPEGAAIAAHGESKVIVGEPPNTELSTDSGELWNAAAKKKKANKKVPGANHGAHASTILSESIEPWNADLSNLILPDDSTSPPPLFDEVQVLRTLKLLLPAGQVTELRVLGATLRGNRGWPAVLSGYFDNPRKLIAALYSIESARGIYIVPNVVNPALLARAVNRIKRAGNGELTGDHDIVARRWLLVDCDPVRPAGISATNTEHEAALARTRIVERYLRDQGWREPVVADSGNGGHLLFAIDLPAEDGGMVEKCLKALHARFSDDVVKIDTGVFNAGRIWKLYGTVAGKGDHTVARPHRKSRILSAPQPS